MSEQFEDALANRSDPQIDAAVPSEGPSAGGDGDPLRVMHVESVLYDLTDPSPAIQLLEAESPFRYLVVPIALGDAISLQQAHPGIDGRRPGTHELVTTVLTRLGAEVVSARIVRLEAGVFYGELEIMGPRGRELFDCRTSDAITLALRQRVSAPVLCAESVLTAYYA